jgi:hypothetical protein
VVWALPAPRAFYDGFPLAGHPRVAPLPPYNEHLIRDVVAFSLALTVVLAATARTLDRTMARVALVALSVYAVPHTISTPATWKVSRRATPWARPWERCWTWSSLRPSPR